jgi:hypothetical protein
MARQQREAVGTPEREGSIRLNDRREELTRQGWPHYFETLTKEAEGFDVTIEVVGPELGDQFEAEKLPLAYLAYDNKDDVFIVAVGGRDRRYPVLRHMIEHPDKILADSRAADTPWAVEVVGSDGDQTIVTLDRRPALPPSR